MKHIKKIIEYLKKNKEWVFSGIGISVIGGLMAFLFSKNENVSNIQNQYNDLNLVQNIEINGDIYNNAIMESSSTKNEKEVAIMPTSVYLENLKSEIDGKIMYYYCDDYDNDGNYEMFALVGDYINYDDLYNYDNLCGKLWYISQNDIMEIESDEIEYWSFPTAFSVGNHVFIAFEQYFVTGSRTYIWGVKNGEPYQPNISGLGNGLIVDNNEIFIIDSTYDLAFDISMDDYIGHTWKRYYFYFEENEFWEYGGIKVDIGDILKISGVKEIVNEIYNNSYVIDSIYYRSNGIININISQESERFISYKNITLRYDGEELNIVESEFGDDYGEGIYLRALIPSAASYPDEFPY